MQKKYLIPIIIVLVVIIAVIITLSCKKKQTGVKLTNPDGETISFPQMSLDGKSIYYFSQDKKMLKLWDLGRNKTENIVALNFDKVDNISYSPDLNQALVHWSNPQNAFDAHTWLASLRDKKLEKELSTNIINTAWSPDGSKIAYHYFDWDNDINNIAISDPNGSNPKTLIDTDAEDLGLAWADNKSIIYYNIPSEQSTTELSLIDITTKKRSTIASDIYIGDSKSILDQNKVVIDVTKDINQGYKLNIYDNNAKKLTALDTLSPVIQTGQVDKSAILYSAYRPTNAQTDQIAKIDLATNTINNLNLKLNGNIETDQIFPTSDSKTLFIVAKGLLYKLSL